jgi:hypothetical protein
MRDQNKKTKKEELEKSSTRGQKQSPGDSDSKLLQQIAKNLGNKGIQDELNQRSGQRDQLLDFICTRLKAVQNVQQIELMEMNKKDFWDRDVARGTAGFSLPEPTRWHECARSFKEAAIAICQGNLGRGKQLLDRAIEQEKAAYESLPKQVKNNLDKKQQSGDSTPIALAGMSTNAVCPISKTPKDLKIADQILNVRSEMEKVHPLRIFKPLHWWETPEEQEEQEENEELEEELQEEQKQEEDHLTQKIGNERNIAKDKTKQNKDQQ